GWGSSFNTSDYFYIRLEANTGYALDLNYLVIQTKKSGTGPGTVIVRSSVDNFTNNIYSNTSSSTGNITRLIYLTGSQYNSLTGVVEFRVYAYGASSGNGTFSINQFSFTSGSVFSAAPVINNQQSSSVSSGSANLQAN